ncbi:MAG: response regulator [Bdellovibrio sp.]|nr:MAG: response regulator [Bdellovibrio sp.]
MIFVKISKKEEVTLFDQHTQILVVDDSPNIRHIICETLKKMGFKNIDQAPDANTGLSKLVSRNKSSSPIQLVLSDLNMPGPSGLDFLKKIRKMEEFKNLPFILITTESEKAAVIDAAMSGVSAYVVKPFNFETLKNRILEAWKKHYGVDS